MARLGAVRVFLSVGHPHLSAQARFVARLEASLRARGFTPWTLGRTDYDYRNPLRAIREAMVSCDGAVIVGLGRRFHPLGTDRFGAAPATDVYDFWTATPWNHLEAGMAFQLDLPLLILKDKDILPEGILDQSVGEYLVFEFDLGEEAGGLSFAIKETIRRWSADVLSRAERHSR